MQPGSSANKKAAGTFFHADGVQLVFNGSNGLKSHHIESHVFFFFFAQECSSKRSICYVNCVSIHVHLVCKNVSINPCTGFTPIATDFVFHDAPK